MQRKLTCGRPIILALLLAGVALIDGCVSSGAVPSDIRLPEYVKVLPPDPSLPRELAKFSGKWSGAWYWDGAYIADSLIVVEKIDKQSAMVFYAGIGRSERMLGQKWGSRYRAELIDGDLVFALGGSYATVIKLRVDASNVMHARGEFKSTYAGAAWVGTFRKIAGAEAAAVSDELRLPETVKVFAPDPSLPRELTKFSGKWRGSWNSEADGTYRGDAIIVVERIDEYSATIFYAVINRYGRKWAFRYGGKVIDGALVFVLENANAISLRVGGDKVMRAHAKDRKPEFNWVGAFESIRE